MSYLGPSLRREKLTERPVRRTGTALLASLALNVLALWVLAAAGAFQLPAKPDSTRVALAPVSASQWEANRRLGAPKAPRSTPAQDDDQPKGRVVELSPEQKARKPAEKPPPDARFDSDRNSDVEKETVSRHADHYPRLAPRPTAAPKQEVARPRRPRRGRRALLGRSSRSRVLAATCACRISARGERAGGARAETARRTSPSRPNRSRASWVARPWTARMKGSRRARRPGSSRASSSTRRSSTRCGPRSGSSGTRASAMPSGSAIRRARCSRTRSERSSSGSPSTPPGT